MLSVIRPPSWCPAVQHFPCGSIVYNADLFPASYRGNSFVCDPANNLIHRDQLVPAGPIFKGIRADPDHEFIASTDNWFRPVNLTIGPDGAMYIVDFYREAIETPLSLPDDIKARLNLASRGRGRIWRVVPEGKHAARRPNLRQEKSNELVLHLDDSNPWWRLNAQRLLVGRQDKSALDALEPLIAKATTHQDGACVVDVARPAIAERRCDCAALNDESAGVRAGLAIGGGEVRHVSGRFGGRSSPWWTTKHRSCVFSWPCRWGVQARRPLARHSKLLRKTVWILVQTAVLSSCERTAGSLAAMLVRDSSFTVNASEAQLKLLSRLASIVGARRDDADLERTLAIVGDSKAGTEQSRRALLDGLGQGLRNGQSSLSRLWDHPPPALQTAIQRIRPYFELAAAVAQDDKTASAERLDAIRLLGYGPVALAAPALQQLLAPQQPVELQLAAVRALSVHDQPKIAADLLGPWNGYSPAVRREVVEAIFAQAGRLKVLLDAIEKKQVVAGQLDPFRLEQLRKHRDANIRRRAQALLANQATPSRQAVVDEYRAALDLTASSSHGREVFKKTCSTCHRLENVGTEVGPDLLSALRNKTREALLIDILDPSREVDPRFLNYIVTTKAGRVFTGLIAVEAPSSITLRRAEKAEDTILRGQIDEIQATAKSVMPEEMEKQLTKQDVADDCYC